MPTETGLVTNHSPARQMTPGTGVTTLSDGAIAFRDHLHEIIHAEKGPDSAGVAIAGAVNSTVPLPQRLYGTPPSPAAITLPANNSVALKQIQSFANAIRAPASVAAIELGTSTNTIIAFAGLETGWGKHIPGSGDNNSNNLFGIKAHNGIHPSVTNSTTEYIDGEAHSIDQRFRSYQSIGESISDFSLFLRSNPRYDKALSQASNPTQFIKMVHEAGYATDPDYANKVIGALQQLDNITKTTGAIGIGWR